METVGEKIRCLRAINNINQEQLANKLEISRNYISQIESDRKIPSFKLLKKISIEFKIPIGNLVDDERSVIDIRKLIKREDISEQVRSLQNAIDELKKNIP